MTSPPSPVSDHGTAIHRFVTPTARIISAAVILITGMGISAIFWKMPAGSELHALYNEDIVSKDLAAIPLPSESNAMLAPDEQITFPALDIAPVTDSGAERYAQIYPRPASLAALDAEQTKKETPTIQEEETLLAAPQKFEPIRTVVEKPIFVESVNREFQSQPVSVNTTEKSDELLSQFYFVGNSRPDIDDSIEMKLPEDPFPMAAVSALPPLQPLQPIRVNGLSPLQPLHIQ